jgi:hypothetical protein
MTREPLLIRAVDSDQVRAVISAEVAKAVNEASASLRGLRDLCDRAEVAARNEPLNFRDSVAVFEARMELIDQVRALLPPLGEVTTWAATSETTASTPAAAVPATDPST